MSEDKMLVMKQLTELLKSNKYVDAFMLLLQEATKEKAGTAIPGSEVELQLVKIQNEQIIAETAKEMEDFFNTEVVDFLKLNNASMTAELLQKSIKKLHGNALGLAVLFIVPLAGLLLLGRK